MQFAQNDALKIISCTRCRSSGLGTIGKCRECYGKGRVAWWNNELLYWNWPVSRYHIALRRGRQIVNTIRIMGGLVFTLSFVGLFFWNVYRLNVFTEIIHLDFWLYRSVPGKVFLWWALLVFGYVWYRIIVMGKPAASIPNYDHIEFDPNNSPVLTWSEIRKQKK